MSSLHLGRLSLLIGGALCLVGLTFGAFVAVSEVEIAMKAQKTVLSPEVEVMDLERRRPLRASEVPAEADFLLWTEPDGQLTQRFLPIFRPEPEPVEPDPTYDDWVGGNESDYGYWDEGDVTEDIIDDPVSTVTRPVRVRELTSNAEGFVLRFDRSVSYAPRSGYRLRVSNDLVSWSERTPASIWFLSGGEFQGQLEIPADELDFRFVQVTSTYEEIINIGTPTAP